MMDCENVSLLFGKIFDGEADEADHKVVEDHLTVCSACSEDYNWYKLTMQALNNLQPVSPPSDFLEQLNSRIHPKSKFANIKSFIKNFFDSVPQIPVPVGAVSLALIVIVAFMAYNNVPVDTSLAIAPIAGAKSIASSVDGGALVNKVSQSQGQAAPPPVASAPRLPMLAANQAANTVSSAPAWRFPTIADEIGGDNLTVESPRVDLAIESLRNVLPNLEGKIVDEKTRNSFGEVMVGVVIPSNKYADLASALVNHGSVEAGTLQIEGKALIPSRTDSNQLRLYIRFTRSSQ